MDSLSHALIGLAVASLSCHQPALNDPVYIAAVLGSQAPDFDIIAQLRGSISYLRQHRFFSHSIPGLTFWSLSIAGILQLSLVQPNFVQNIFWAFMGGLSHILIDYFNTHGVALLWPFKKDRKSVPLLNVFDPIILLILLIPYAFQLSMRSLSFATFTALAAYILLRYLLRRQLSIWLKKYFCDHVITKMWLMPSLNHLLFWDFVIETNNRIFIGHRGMLHSALTIKADLPKHQLMSPLTQKAQQTCLGQFFHLFTPYSFFEEHWENDSVKVTIYDLRYYANQQFIHSGTILFDLDQVPSEYYLHSMGRTLKFAAET
ncbi:MAG: Protein of unknown function transrane [Firmicutes bacterium]|nr:Protein of unknown function transrane [Bacillota bacterium]